LSLVNIVIYNNIIKDTPIKMRILKELTISLAVLLFIGSSSALNNGLGKTPAMGWNTWNKYGCDISEAIIKSNA